MSEFDLLLETYTKGRYIEEIVEARKEYFEKTGPIHDGDPEFNDRNQLFLDWYLFDRPIKKNQLSPIDEFLSHHPDSSLTPYAKTIHSIFEVKKIKKKELHLIELFSERKFVVETEENGFSQKDLFEGRILPFLKSPKLSNGFCFHPSEVRNFIKKSISEIKDQPKEHHQLLIFKFSNMKLKSTLFPHIPVEGIYSWTSKI